MHVLGHLGEGGVEVGMFSEGWVFEEDRSRFVAGDFDEAGVAEVTHGDIGNAGLSESEEGARTADFQIFLGEEESVIALDEGIEAVVGAVFPRQEEAVGGVCSASDAPAELVELRESESVGVFDNHDGRIGHINAHFDDRGGDKHVYIARFECLHHAFFVGGLHFSVEESDGEFGEHFCGEFLVFGFGGFDFGERGGFFDERQNDKNLPTFFDFLSRESEDGFSRVARRGDFGGDGDAIFGQFIEYGNIEIAKERDGECARNRRCGEREEVRRCVWQSVL